jgi:hypothetical protein
MQSATPHLLTLVDGHLFRSVHLRRSKARLPQAIVESYLPTPPHVHARLPSITYNVHISYKSAARPEIETLKTPPFYQLLKSQNNSNTWLFILVKKMGM